MEQLAFVIPFSWSVGVSVSIDIFFFTLAKSTVENLNWRNWTIPATAAHVVLMSIVVGNFYLLGNSFDFLHLPLAVLGALIIGRYLYELTSQWRSIETNFSLTNELEQRFGKSRLLCWLNAQVLAVSWDCIPVAAGIAPETNTWTGPQLLAGLVVIALTVAGATQASLIVSHVAKGISNNVSIDQKTLAKMFGNWVILSLLGGFLILSLTKGFAPWFSSIDDLEVLNTLPISATLATMFFAIHWHALWTEQAHQVV